MWIAGAAQREHRCGHAAFTYNSACAPSSQGASGLLQWRLEQLRLPGVQDRLHQVGLEDCHDAQNRSDGEDHHHGRGAEWHAVAEARAGDTERQRAAAGAYVDRGAVAAEAGAHAGLGDVDLDAGSDAPRLAEAKAWKE